MELVQTNATSARMYLTRNTALTSVLNPSTTTMAFARTVTLPALAAMDPAIQLVRMVASLVTGQLSTRIISLSVVWLRMTLVQV